MQARPGAEYAYYFGDGGAFYEAGIATPWWLIDQVVSELHEDELPDLRIGEVIPCEVRDILNREDILEIIASRPLTVDALQDYISEIHGSFFDDQVDLEVFIIGDNVEVEAAKEEFKNLVASIPARFRDTWEGRDPTEDLEFADAESLSKVADEAADRIVEWAVKHIELGPSNMCFGIYPLPIELVEGEWHYGRTKDEGPPATISINHVFLHGECLNNDDEDGCRWRWTLPNGTTGDCTSLEDAMQVSRATLDAGNGNAQE